MHRLEALRGRLPNVYGRCREDRQDSRQIQDARHPILWGYESRGTLPSGTSIVSTRAYQYQAVLSQPSVGGICVDMSKMDRIIEIHGESV